MAAFRTPILVAALGIVALATSSKENVCNTEVCGTDGQADGIESSALYLLQTKLLVQELGHAEKEGEFEAASSGTVEDEQANKEEEDKNNGTSKATPCQTSNAEACAFPFKYKGIMYDSCTSADANQPWCGTQTDAHAVSASWGYCAGSCSVLAPEKCTTKSALHYKAEACTFPFKSAGVTYNSCTSKSYDRLWCATNADKTGAYSSWADCGSCAAGAAPTSTGAAGAAGAATNLGIVDELYTYGPPGAGYFEDLSHSSGCFPGMRSYTENKHKYWPTVVDFASVASPFQHARTGTLVLDWESDSMYFGCPGKSTWPKGVKWGMVPSVTIHMSPMYKDRIQYNTASVLDSAQYAGVFLSIKMVSLPYNPDAPSIKKLMLEDTPGWTLVAHHVIAGYAGLTSTDTDVIMLAQNAVSLECVLAFEGTDSRMELLTSLFVASTSFCGFPYVHKGFTEELWSITSSTQYQTDVRPKLGKCSKVTVVGHSLGGAISEVFAACINSRRTDEKVYKQMSWTKGTAEKMSEI